MGPARADRLARAGLRAGAWPRWGSACARGGRAPLRHATGHAWQAGEHARGRPGGPLGGVAGQRSPDRHQVVPQPERCAAASSTPHTADRSFAWLDGDLDPYYYIMMCGVIVSARVCTRVKESNRAMHDWQI
jgi:hypothetical protein